MSDLNNGIDDGFLEKIFREIFREEEAASQSEAEESAVKACNEFARQLGLMREAFLKEGFSREEAVDFLNITISKNEGAEK